MQDSPSRTSYADALLMDKAASSSSQVEDALVSHQPDNDAHISTIHAALPRLRQHNIKQILLHSPEEILCSIFRSTVEADLEVHTTFSSFSRPRPFTAPLSLLGISQRCHTSAEAQSELWASLSGTQHEPNVPHPDLVVHWIHRAGEEQPLNFHISPGIRSPHNIDSDFTTTIFHTFLQYIPRWKNIAFELNKDLAAMYLDHLLGEGKPRPGMVENLELSMAAPASSYDIALDVFRSIEKYSASVKRLHWGNPAQFLPLIPRKVPLPVLTTLSISAPSILEVCACLDAMHLAKLEDLHIRSSWNHPVEGGNGEPGGDIVRFHSALHRMEAMPRRLLIMDDDMADALAQLVVEMASNSHGISKLTIVSPRLQNPIVYGAQLCLYEGAMEIYFSM